MGAHKGSFAGWAFEQIPGLASRLAGSSLDLGNFHVQVRTGYQLHAARRTPHPMPIGPGTQVGNDAVFCLLSLVFSPLLNCPARIARTSGIVTMIRISDHLA